MSSTLADGQLAFSGLMTGLGAFLRQRFERWFYWLPKVHIKSESKEYPASVPLEVEVISHAASDVTSV